MGGATVVMDDITGICSWLVGTGSTSGCASGVGVGWGFVGFFFFFVLLFLLPPISMGARHKPRRGIRRSSSHQGLLLLSPLPLWPLPLLAMLLPLLFTPMLPSGLLLPSLLPLPMLSLPLSPLPLLPFSAVGAAVGAMDG